MINNIGIPNVPENLVHSGNLTEKKFPPKELMERDSNLSVTRGRDTGTEGVDYKRTVNAVRVSLKDRYVEFGVGVWTLCRRSVSGTGRQRDSVEVSFVSYLLITNSLFNKVRLYTERM